MLILLKKIHKNRYFCFENIRVFLFIINWFDACTITNVYEYVYKKRVMRIT